MSFELEKAKFLLDWDYKNYLKYGDLKSLLNISRKFYLPIDFDRLEDYDMEVLYGDVSKIKVYDKKNNITYISSCKKDEEKRGLGFSIDVLEEGNDYKLIRHYLSKKRMPYCEELELYHEGKKVIFKKEYSDYDTSLNIMYPDVFEYEICSNGKSRCKDVVRHYQHEKDFLEDEYIFTSSNNLVYSVNTQSSDCFIKGMCFTRENVPNIVREKLQFTDFNNMFFPECFLENASSYISFHGIGKEGIGYLDITKKKDVISVGYQTDRIKPRITESRGFEIKSNNDGYIDNEDVLKIVQELKNRYSDDVIPFFCDKLNNFSRQLESYNTKTNNFDNLLLDKYYLLSIYDILELALENKEVFFQLINKEVYRKNREENTLEDSKKKCLKID